MSLLLFFAAEIMYIYCTCKNIHLGMGIQKGNTFLVRHCPLEIAKKFFQELYHFLKTSHWLNDNWSVQIISC